MLSLLQSNAQFSTYFFGGSAFEQIARLVDKKQKEKILEFSCLSLGFSAPILANFIPCDDDDDDDDISFQLQVLQFQKSEYVTKNPIFVCSSSLHR
jgi:hypothetical protein